MKTFILSYLFPYSLIPLPARHLLFCLLLAGGFPIVTSAQVTEKTMGEAFRSLKDGTAKVDSLNQLCRALDDNEKAITYGIKVMDLAGKINYKKGIAQALNNTGVAYYSLEKGAEALEYHQKALKIRQELGDKKDIAASYSNMGNTYDLLGNMKEAIDYHTKSLRLKEEKKDTLGMGISCNNIASAYLDIPDYYKAIDFGFKAVKLYDAVGEKSALAHALNNIGLAYELLRDFDKALDYYQKALTLQQELGNKGEIAILLDNIANIYQFQGRSSKDNVLRTSKFRSALENYFKSLEIRESIDDKEGIATVNNNMGNAYWGLNDFPNALASLNKSLDTYKQLDSKSGITRALNSLAKHFKLQKKYNQSINYGLQAFAIADSIQDAEQVKDASEILSDDYREMKQFEKSLFYYKRYADEKENLINVKGIKDLAQEESRLEFEKKEQQLKLEQEKQNAIAEAESRRQKVIIGSVAIGLLLVIVFSAFIYNRFRLTQKQNKIIEEQKNLVDEKNSALETANIEIAQKNKDITDSINYAQHLQQAILPPEKLWKQHLKESFVFFKPKDIVAGDFYWMEIVDGKILFAAADCTGHGIPGAMVSVVCSNALNNAVKEFRLTEPGKILDKATQVILSTFEKSESEVKDGMDISLCCFDTNTNELSWAGANNPLWYLKNGGIEELVPDKQPVGKSENPRPFKTNSVNMKKGDSFYTFTDGYADQFGGPKGKKFKYKQFEEIILANSHLPMHEQKIILNKKLEEWKGELEQVDDILVIGVRI